MQKRKKIYIKAWFPARAALQEFFNAMHVKLAFLITLESPLKLAFLFSN
jgi:hypothetical protein